MRSKSRRSFLVMGGSAAAGVAGWQWLTTRPQAGGLSHPLRRTLEFNEELAESYFQEARRRRRFRVNGREPRLDGDEGLSAEFDPSTWRLQVMGAGEARTVTLEDIKRLRRIEMTTDTNASRLEHYRHLGRCPA